MEQNINMNLIPTFLAKMLELNYGKEKYNLICKGYNVKRPTTLRVNTLKTDKVSIENALKSQNISFKKVRWSDDAYILKNADEQKIKTLSIYENGEIYLQSLSSMLPPIILQPKVGADILDMTAAPGGKTTQIAALTQNRSNITACEMNNIRFERLKYNVEKQGAKCVYLMKEDSRRISDFFSFDQILLDAPCSGSGTSNVNIITEELIKKSVKAQKALIKKAIKILKPGGSLVYSTCSILPCENEEMIEEALKNPNMKIEPIEFEGIEDLPLLDSKIKGTLCVCPNDLYEGFYIAKLNKIR